VGIGVLRVLILHHSSVTGWVVSSENMDILNLEHDHIVVIKIYLF